MIPGAGDPHPVLPPRAERFHIIGGDTTAIHRRTDELEDKARVVVVQIGIRILKAAVIVSGVDRRFFRLGDRLAEQTRRAGEEAAKDPIDPGARPDKPGRKTETLLDRGVKTDLLDARRITFDHVVAALAQAPDQIVIVTLQILDPAPGEIAGLLAGETGKIAQVDQRYLGPLARQGRRRNRPIDPASNDQRVINPISQLLQIARAKLHDALLTGLECSLLTPAAGS